MTDVDRIYEAALADEWEEQNRPESESFPDWKEATEKLKQARALISDAVTLIFEASNMVEGSTFEDRIASFGSCFEDHGAALATLTERMIAK